MTGPPERARATTERLGIAGLTISFGSRQVVAIEDLWLDRAEILGLAGESGSGKSMTTLAILGLAHTVGASVTGSITFAPSRWASEATPNASEASVRTPVITMFLPSSRPMSVIVVTSVP